MPTGILIVDKPEGWTSQDVVSKLRGVFHEKRIGHGGTLDPMATGVLPVFLGRATRAVQFFESAEKEYVAGLRLGLVTDTQDTTGTVLSEQPVSVSEAQLKAALSHMEGPQLQVPPMYSAVKIGGKKLYELARKGKEVERQPRPITLFSLELLSFDGRDAQIRIRCSKGTYVRTICHDLGQALSCGGCMYSLRRTAAGCYLEAQSIPLTDIFRHGEAGTLDTLLLPLSSLFDDQPAITLTAAEEARCRNGAANSRGGLKDGSYRLFSENGEFLALGCCEHGVLSTVKSFFEVKEV